MSSTLKELQDLIHQKFDIDPATLDPTASMRDKGFDSLALVEFLFAIEDHFHISMRDEDSNIDTLVELAAVVDKLRAEAPARPAGSAATTEVVDADPGAVPATAIAPPAAAPAAATPPAAPGA